MSVPIGSTMSSSEFAYAKKKIFLRKIFFPSSQIFQIYDSGFMLSPAILILLQHYLLLVVNRNT